MILTKKTYFKYLISSKLQPEPLQHRVSKALEVETKVLLLYQINENNFLYLPNRYNQKFY